jgi:hypothetical protein
MQRAPLPTLSAERGHARGGWRDEHSKGRIRPLWRRPSRRRRQQAASEEGLLLHLQLLHGCGWRLCLCALLQAQAKQASKLITLGCILHLQFEGTGCMPRSKERQSGSGSACRHMCVSRWWKGRGSVLHKPLGAARMSVPSTPPPAHLGGEVCVQFLELLTFAPLHGTNGTACAGHGLGLCPAEG